MFGDIRAFLERFPAATTSEVVLNRHHFLGLQTPRGVRTPAVNATAQRAHSDVHAHLGLGAFSNPSLGGTIFCTPSARAGSVACECARSGIVADTECLPPSVAYR